MRRHSYEVFTLYLDNIRNSVEVGYCRSLKVLFHVDVFRARHRLDLSSRNRLLLPELPSPTKTTSSLSAALQSLNISLANITSPLKNLTLKLTYQSNRAC